MTTKILILILLAECFAVIAQVLFKRGVRPLENQRLKSANDYLKFLKVILASPLVYWGILGMALWTVLWITVLAGAELSLVFPIESVQYILVMLGAYLFLRESINWTRLVGTSLIVAGIALVSLG